MTEHPISPRVAAMQPSATLAMSSRVKARKREGHPVIGLSAGEPDFDTPKPIADAAVVAIGEGFTRYTENPGMLPLREAISRKLREENDLEFGPDEIVCSNGAKQSVAMTVSVLSGEGDEVLIPSPYWVSYPEMARFAGATPVVVQTRVEDRYLLTPKALDEAITERTRLLMLCSPSNPTGAAYTPEAIEALAEVLRGHPQVYVMSDEIYEHIRYDIGWRSIGSLPWMRDRTVTVNGFSKAYAMTGWRLGYLAADRPVARAVAKLQSQITSAPSSITQKAGIAALEMGLDPVRNMVSAFRERRDFMVDALEKLPGVRCPRPNGAFYLFPAVDELFGLVTPEGKVIDSAETFCFHLLEEHDVALVPGGAFGDPNGVRISYAASMDDIREAMRRITRAVTALG